MIPPLQSLVKYDNAVLVSSTKEKKVKDKLLKVSSSSSWVTNCVYSCDFNYLLVSVMQSGGLLPGEQKSEVPQTEDILNSILPPRSGFYFVVSCKELHALAHLPHDTGSGQKTVSFGCNMCQVRQPPD